MKKTRVTLIILLLAAVPAGRYLLEFHLGEEGRPEGYGMVNGLFFLFVAPFVIAIATGLLMPVRGVWKRLGVACLAFILTPLLALFAVPAGAIIYSHGFEYAVRKRVGIDVLQQWATETLVRYEQSKLALAGEASYWSPGDVLVSTNELPVFLKTGFFAPSGIPNFGPEISICTNGVRFGRSNLPNFSPAISISTNAGRFGVENKCVVISWYLHGLLIGPAGFTNNWNPWYCRELSSGVYSYYVEK